MEIDVTKEPEEIEKIIFRNDGEDFQVFLEQSEEEEYFKIGTTDDEYFHIRYRDIDNMVKALQKAKELWAN